MIRAYSPGHLTCFFQPVRVDSLATSGSRGAGVRLSLGSEVSVEETRSGVRVFLDGEPSEARVSRRVADLLAPGRGLEVYVLNSLPMGQGMGMSASGAVALGLCLCGMLGLHEEEAYAAAHVAEVECGGGLGDVAGISCRGHQPVRVSPGLPPAGRVEDTGISLHLSLAVLGGPLSTGSVLGDPEMSSRISRSGGFALEEYLAAPSADSLFRLSNRFSADSRLETGEVSRAIGLLKGAGFRAGMCMLGHSVFTDAPASETAELLPQARVFRCPSTAEPARIIRKA
jgi:pantoate kinase